MISVKEISEQLNYSFFGDETKIVKGIRYINEADENYIGVAFNESDINNSKAEVVLTTPNVINIEKMLLFTSDDIYTSIIKIVEIFIEKGIYKDYTKAINYSQHDNYYCGENVSIGTNTVIEPFTVIGNDVVIGNNCRIGSNVFIGSGSIMKDNVVVCSGAKIGSDAFFHYGSTYHTFVGIGKVVLNNNVEIGFNTSVQRGTLSDTLIGEDTKIGNLVDIGHDTKVGHNCKIVSQTGISGNVEIGNNVLMLGQTGVSNNVKIGNNVVVKGKTSVIKNVMPDTIISGRFGRDNTEEMRYNAKLRKFIKERT